MELQLQNPDQHRIADLLWNAKDDKEVKIILRLFGHDAHVVYNMMLAAYYDSCDDVTEASEILNGIFKNER